MTPNAVFESDLPGLQLIKRGKVRDMYEVEGGIILIASDRISAYDVVMPNPIPGKGEILNKISNFWFIEMSPLVANHIIATDPRCFPEECQPYTEILQGRTVYVKKAKPLPIECVVRGYISGSGWKSYQESGEVCGIELPAGLKESDQLAEPIFTPSTKEDQGKHDINISFKEAANLVGENIANQVKELSLSIYKKGAAIAEKKGIIIADTKFEFGILDDHLILIDEVLTPDSSRFWPKATYKPGGPQNSFDKQYLRDYLTAQKWDKKPPAPTLPDEVVQNTYKKYMEALTALTA